ncbi:MAG: hypothetical protein JWO81_172 [Alphaproteobacteria bacterium]|nr:hypothetical protein [Alphaproteobacteria bacterium]
MPPAGGAEMDDPVSPSPSAKRPSKTTVERAFELARSGECNGMSEIAAQLKREWHEAVDAHLAGPSIRKELRKIWKAAEA